MDVANSPLGCIRVVLLLYGSFKEYIAFSQGFLLGSLSFTEETNMHGIISGSFLLLTLNPVLQDIAGAHLSLDAPKWSHVLHLDRLNSYAGNKL